MTSYSQATLERRPAPSKRGNAVTQVRPDKLARQAAVDFGGPDLRVFETPKPALPVASYPARRGLGLSFGLMVLLPLVAFIAYLWFVAEDQYASSAGFTVRSEESLSPQDLLGGLARFAGQGGGSDGDILYAYIQSQEMVAAVDRALDLRTHYSRHWPSDWLFSLWPDASIEDLVWFWNRVVQVAYDQATGLIEVRVLAFDPEFAHDVARQIVLQSEARVNALNARARADAIGYAQRDLDTAHERLRTARTALTAFRLRTMIVDPAADLQNRMGVMTKLQEQLAEKLIEFDALQGTTRPDDPRLTQLRHMLGVIRQRIAQERRTFASDKVEDRVATGSAAGESYPALIAEYQGLAVDQTFAEESYRAALAALDLARADADRRSRYLATYIRPTLASTSKFPNRVLLAGMAALFLFLFWSMVALVYGSLRDRR